MKKRTKILSLFLAVLMLLSVMPVTVFADLQEGDFTYIVEGGTATITGYKGSGGVVQIPETLGGYPVTTIGTYAFTAINMNVEDYEKGSPTFALQPAYKISTVIIPSSVTKIMDYAFVPAKSFTNNLLVPSLLQYVSDWNIYIPSSVEYINDAAFICVTFSTDEPVSDQMHIDIFYEGSPDELNDIYTYQEISVDTVFDEIDIFKLTMTAYTKNTFTYNTSYNTACHNWVVSSVTYATCTEDGTTTSVCSICNDEKTEITQTRKGHSYDAVVTAPTCTQQGYTTYTCDCGDSYVSDYVGTIPHEYSEEITTPATHLKDGVKTYTCECGDTYTQSIERIKTHTYNEVVTAPTCTAQGYTTYTCECGYSYNDNFTDATGHQDADNNSICDICNAQLNSGSESSLSGFMAFILSIIQFIRDLFKSVC